MNGGEDVAKAFTIKAHPTAEMSEGGSVDQLPSRRPAKLRSVNIKASPSSSDLKDILDHVPFTPSQGVRSPTPRSNGMVYAVQKPALSPSRLHGVFDYGPQSPVMMRDFGGDWHRPVFMMSPVPPFSSAFAPGMAAAPHVSPPGSPVHASQGWPGMPFAQPPTSQHMAFMPQGPLPPHMLPSMLHEAITSVGYSMTPHEVSLAMSMAGVMANIDPHGLNSFIMPPPPMTAAMSMAMAPPLSVPMTAAMALAAAPPPSPLRSLMPPMHSAAQPPHAPRPHAPKPLDIVSVQERLLHAQLHGLPLPAGPQSARESSSRSPERRRYAPPPMTRAHSNPAAVPRVDRRAPSPYHLGAVSGEAEDLVSSEGSPSKESPDVGGAKTKVEPRIGMDGELVFNARQRRTLRRALQRARKASLDDGRDFDVSQPFSEQERALIVEIIEQHISWPIPKDADVDKLARMLLSLGPSEGEPGSPRAGGLDARLQELSFGSPLP